MSKQIKKIEKILGDSNQSSIKEFDIVFLIDSTASMDPYIEAAKSESKNISKHLRNLYPEMNFQYGYVFYRDPIDSKEDKHEIINLTDQVNDLPFEIGKIKAYGGGDLPEDWVGAYKKVNNEINWRNGNKVIFHIADAGAHGKLFTPSDKYPNEDKKLIKEIEICCSKNIKIFAFVIEEDSRNSFIECKKIYQSKGGTYEIYNFPQPKVESSHYSLFKIPTYSNSLFSSKNIKSIFATNTNLYNNVNHSLFTNNNHNNVNLFGNTYKNPVGFFGNNENNNNTHSLFGNNNVNRSNNNTVGLFGNTNTNNNIFTNNNNNNVGLFGNNENNNNTNSLFGNNNVNHSMFKNENNNNVGLFGNNNTNNNLFTNNNNNPVGLFGNNENNNTNSLFGNNNENNNIFKNENNNNVGIFGNNENTNSLFVNNNENNNVFSNTHNNNVGLFGNDNNFNIPQDNNMNNENPNLEMDFQSQINASFKDLVVTSIKNIQSNNI